MNKVTAILSALIFIMTASLLALAFAVSLKMVQTPSYQAPLEKKESKIIGEVISFSKKDLILVLKTPSGETKVLKLPPTLKVLDLDKEIKPLSYLEEGFRIEVEGVKSDSSFTPALIKVIRVPEIYLDFPTQGAEISEILELRGRALKETREVKLLILKGEDLILKRNLQLKNIGEIPGTKYYLFSNNIFLPFYKLPQRTPITLKLKSDKDELSVYLSYKVQGLLSWYNNPTLRISFVYPSLWQENLEYGKIGNLPIRYEGLDGFFELSLSGESNIGIQKVIEAITSSNPAYQEAKVKDFWPKGRRGKLILGKQKGALVLEYSVPLEIKGKFYRFLILESTPEYIENLASTLTFAQAPLVKVDLYFGNHILDPTQTCSKVFKVEREIYKFPTLIKDTLSLLLDGPTSQEKNQGYFSNIPSNSKLLDFEIREGKAIIEIQLGSPFTNNCEKVGAEEQITSTLMQFPEVEEVKIEFISQ